MPERPLTIYTYATGASLAAAIVVYVFGPTLFNGGSHDRSFLKRKATPGTNCVGLSNPANDCFINSVLQALSGLSKLRLYLVGEENRKNSEANNAVNSSEQAYLGREKGAHNVESSYRESQMLLGSKGSTVTIALKDILDSLNEHPIYRKTISAQPFVLVLERAFNARISRQQQDAHEFLQAIVGKLDDEHQARRKIMFSAVEQKEADIKLVKDSDCNNIVESTKVIWNSASQKQDTKLHEEVAKDAMRQKKVREESDGSFKHFPFEGQIESQIECSTCHFRPKPMTSSFLVLTLPVPRKSSASLNSCFDSLFRVEHIEDFRCEACRLHHVLALKEEYLPKAQSPGTRSSIENDIALIRKALETDPEQPLTEVRMPSKSEAPKRRIARYTQMSRLPGILAIHLSRSIFNMTAPTTKNTTPVSFPETLSLGGLLSRTRYTLCAVVTHKGGHHSGHYETFRCQRMLKPMLSRELSLPKSTTSHQPASQKAEAEHETMQRAEEDDSPKYSDTDKSSQHAKKRQKKSSATSKRGANRRWWRISDDKVREVETSDVLAMQKEVYMLFYERDDD